MTLQDFKTVAEEILLTLLSRPLQKLPVQSHLIIDSIVQMIRTRGRQNLSTLLKDIHASERQLERLFADAFSLSPKKVSWNEFTRSQRTCLSLSDFYNTRFTICFMIFKNHNFRRHVLWMLQSVFAELTVQNVIAKICARAAMPAKELFFIRVARSVQFIIAAYWTRI